MDKKILRIIAHSGDNVIWIGFSILMLLSFSKQLQYFAILILAASIAGAILSSIIKVIFKRERPIKEKYSEYAPWAKFDLNSFPSGHISRIASVAFTLGYYYPYTFIYMGIYTIILAYSRKKLGYHYASDLIGGVVVGAVSAALVIVLCWKFNFNQP